MSVVEDVRQVVQDFLAPELRALLTRMDALEKVMEARFETVDAKLAALDQKFDLKFATADQKFDLKFAGAEQKSDSNFNILNAKLDSLSDSLAIDRRLAKLESQQPPITQ